MSGEVTEWLKVHAWKACVRKYREFESHPLRQPNDITQLDTKGADRVQALQSCSLTFCQISKRQ